MLDCPKHWSVQHKQSEFLRAVNREGFYYKSPETEKDCSHKE